MRLFSCPIPLASTRFSGRRALPLLLLCFCLLLPHRMTGAAERQLNPEELLAKARHLLRQSDTDPEYARQAADLLEKKLPCPFADPDYLLVLAEAWYRSADPDADIEETFPAFKKAGEYAEQALELDPRRTEAHY